MRYEIPIPIVFAVNGVMLVTALILALIMLNAGVSWSMNTGNTPVQEALKRTILRAMMGLVIIGLAGSIMNLFFV